MVSRSIFTPLVVLLGAVVCHAQQSDNSTDVSNNSTAPSNNNSTVYGPTRQLLVAIDLAAPVPSSPPASDQCRVEPDTGVYLAIYERYTNDTCYSLADIFNPPQDDIYTSIDGSQNTCTYRNNNENNCTNDYTAYGVERFNPDLYYTRVNFVAGARFVGFSRLTVHMYTEEGCDESEQAAPWFAWSGCDGYPREYPYECEDLPRGVRSFRLLAKRTDECLNAAERGAGGKSREAPGLLALVAGWAVVAAGLLVV